MAGRVVHSTGKVALVWVGGGFSMGIGVWAMHFIGMLFVDEHGDGHELQDAAHRLFCGHRCCASIFALWLVCNGDLPLPRLAGGALILGERRIAMHYAGHGGADLSPGIVWKWGWVALSVAIALAASGTSALWLAFNLREGQTSRVTLLALAHGGDGLCYCRMHYTGMMAAELPVHSHPVGQGVNSNWLAILVTVVTISILGITLGVDAGCADAGAYLDSRQFTG